MNSGSKFGRIGGSFDLMFSKRSFVHHYVGEGNEEGEFGDARENVKALADEYAQLDANFNQQEEEDSDEEKEAK